MSLKEYSYWCVVPDVIHVANWRIWINFIIFHIISTRKLSRLNELIWMELTFKILNNLCKFLGLPLLHRWNCSINYRYVRQISRICFEFVFQDQNFTSFKDSILLVFALIIIISVWLKCYEIPKSYTRKSFTKFVIYIYSKKLNLLKEDNLANTLKGWRIYSMFRREGQLWILANSNIFGRFQTSTKTGTFWKLIMSRSKKTKETKPYT